MKCILIYGFRLRTNSFRNTWVEDIVFSLNYSDTNLSHLRLPARIANNHRALIVARIVLAQTFGAPLVVYPLTHMCHSIVFGCGMDGSLNDLIFSHGNFLWTWFIFPMIALLFPPPRPIWCLTLICSTNSMNMVDMNSQNHRNPLVRRHMLGPKHV